MQPRYRLKVRPNHKAGLRVALEWFLRRATWTEDGRYSIKGVAAEDIGARHALYAAIDGEGYVPHHLKQRITTEALAGWYRRSHDPANIEAFEQALMEAARTLEAQSQPFTVITLWNLRPAGERVVFEADGLSTTIGYASVVEGFPLEKVWKEAVDFWYSGPPRWLFQDGEHWIPVMALNPGITTVEAPDSYAAIDLVSHSHDLIRAALNLPRGVRLSLGWSRLPKPLGAVLASPVWAAFKGDRNSVEVAHNLEVLHDIDPVDLPETRVAAAKELLQQVDETAGNHEIARFKSRLLRLYQAALDSTDRQSQFLSFWQVLEAATLVAPGAGEQVESRLRTLFGLSPQSIHGHVIDAMATLRHDLVHRGTYPVDDSEIAACP